VIEILAWAAVTLMALLTLTQAVGWGNSRVVAVVQSATPLLLAPAIPIGVAAAILQHWPLAITCVGIAVALGVLVAPVVHHASPRPSPGSPSMTIAYANLLVRNPTPMECMQALAGTDADVLVLVELSEELSRALGGLVPGDYPYRCEQPLDNPRGHGVWSRHPILAGGLALIGSNPVIDLVLDLRGTPVRVIEVHPAPPTIDPHRWTNDLAALASAQYEPAVPTVMVGDFNASRWHPAFRDLLRNEWTDAHEALGRGFSASWPTDMALPPPFVRLDHALVRNGVEPISISEIEIPGSDHRGFVLTVSVST